MNPNQPKPKRKYVLVILIIIMAALAYFYVYGGKPVVEEGLLAEQLTPEVAAVSTRVLTLLNQIQSLKIDDSVFREPAYQTLRDYSVAIPPQNVGRPNPFAPLPGVRSSGSSSSR